MTSCSSIPACSGLWWKVIRGAEFTITNTNMFSFLWLGFYFRLMLGISEYSEDVIERIEHMALTCLYLYLLFILYRPCAHWHIFDICRNYPSSISFLPSNRPKNVTFTLSLFLFLPQPSIRIFNLREFLNYDILTVIIWEFTTCPLPNCNQSCCTRELLYVVYHVLQL